MCTQKFLIALTTGIFPITWFPKLVSQCGKPGKVPVEQLFYNRALLSTGCITYQKCEITTVVDHAAIDLPRFPNTPITRIIFKPDNESQASS
ncbi:hypothetical protein D3C85_1317740 [compost metagenome]